MAAGRIRKKGVLADSPALKRYATDRDGTELLEFGDTLVSGDGRKKTSVKGKGEAGCALAARLGAYLGKYSVPNYFIDTHDKKSILVQAADRFAFSVTVRNFASEELAGRLGLTAGEQLACPVLEYVYRNDRLRNPLINPYHAVALGLADREETDRINELALKANAVLKPYLSRRGLNLLDFEIEAGRAGGDIILASPLCLDYCSVAGSDGGFVFDRSDSGGDTRKMRTAYSAAAAILEG